MMYVNDAYECLIIHHPSSIIHHPSSLPLAYDGRLGHGTFSSQPTPRLVLISHPSSQRPSVIGLAMGRAHTVVLLSEGSVGVCGSNNFGQLGLPSSMLQQRPLSSLASFCYNDGQNPIVEVEHCSASVRIVPAVTNAIYIAAGDFHTGCVVRRRVVVDDVDVDDGTEVLLWGMLRE